LAPMAKASKGGKKKVVVAVKKARMPRNGCGEDIDVSTSRYFDSLDVTEAVRASAKRTYIDFLNEGGAPMPVPPTTDWIRKFDAYVESL